MFFSYAKTYLTIKVYYLILIWEQNAGLYFALDLDGAVYLFGFEKPKCCGSNRSDPDPVSAPQTLCTNYNELIYVFFL